MPDYTDIEQKSKTAVRPEEEKQETKARNKPAVTGKVKKVKKGLLERLVVGMLGPDGIPAISEYLNREIVVPALKEVFVNSVTSAVNMMVYKSGDHTPPRNYGGNPRQHWQAQSTNYTEAYKPKSNYASPASAQPSAKSRRSNFVDAYTIDKRHEAVFILDSLKEQATLYGRVAVADYYDMLGVEPTYTDNTYGWDEDDLNRYAKVVPAQGGGYELRLPPVMVL